MTPARIITVTALCMAAVATGAQAKGGPPRHHGHVAPDLRHVPKLAAIPPALLAAFPIFGQPAAAKVPDVVLRSVQARLFVKRYGTDPRQARAITGQRGGTWYAIPGRRGLCLFVSAATVCTTTERAAAGNLVMTRHGAPATPGQQVTTIIGLAPSGVTATVVSRREGPPSTTPIAPSGAYRLDVEGPFTRLDLARAGAEPLTIMELEPKA